MPIKKTNKSPSTRKSSTRSTKTKKDDKIIKEKEKEVFMNDMKRTLRDLGRLPALIFAPVVAYVGKKYDKIPLERRKKLEKIMKEIKNKGGDAVGKLKEWFQSMLRHDNTDSNKKTNKTSANTKTRKKKKDGIFAQLQGDVEEKVKAGKKKLEKAKKTATKKVQDAKKTATKKASKISKTAKKTLKTSTKKPTKKTTARKTTSSSRKKPNTNTRKNTRTSSKAKTAKKTSTKKTADKK